MQKAVASQFLLAFTLALSQTVYASVLPVPAVSSSEVDTPKHLERRAFSPLSEGMRFSDGNVIATVTGIVIQDTIAFDTAPGTFDAISAFATELALDWPDNMGTVSVGSPDSVALAISHGQTLMVEASAVTETTNLLNLSDRAFLTSMIGNAIKTIAGQKKKLSFKLVLSTTSVISLSLLFVNNT